MSKSYLNEPTRFQRNYKLTPSLQFERNTYDFQRWVKHDMKALTYKTLSEKHVIDSIYETLELYDIEQSKLLDEMLLN